MHSMICEVLKENSCFHTARIQLNILVELFSLYEVVRERLGTVWEIKLLENTEGQFLKVYFI